MQKKNEKGMPMRGFLALVALLGLGISPALCFRGMDLPLQTIRWQRGGKEAPLLRIPSWPQFSACSTQFPMRPSTPSVSTSTVTSAQAMISSSSFSSSGDQGVGSEGATTATTTFAILGGNGQIGTAVADHLLHKYSAVGQNARIVLAGRRDIEDSKVQRSISELTEKYRNTLHEIVYRQVDDIWTKTAELQAIAAEADCLIHTAGPYLDKLPVPLECAIASDRCQVYVDVGDPLPFLEKSLLLSDDAAKAGTTALVAAGAFPGMSNVLAMEAAQVLTNRSRHPDDPNSADEETDDPFFSPYVQDVRFHYFTAGLGGSGTVNLYITNLGFGEPMVQHDNGQTRFFMALSGLLMGAVDFFLPVDDGGDNSTSPTVRTELDHHHVKQELERAKKRIGKQRVFAWPFPEAATVPIEVKARGNSYASMGTAPDLWNTMLAILVNVIPRPWWRSERFSKFMADFSEPLVRACDDYYLHMTGVGETHGMRIDVTGERNRNGVSIVQCHDSFRRCVGQSCAEFALDALEQHRQQQQDGYSEECNPCPGPGVYLAEQRYRSKNDRKRIIERLTSTPGTFCYSGPIQTAPAPEPTSGWAAAIQIANDSED